MAEDSARPAEQASSRPQLSPDKRSTSYLKDHQQYSPPNRPESHYGIDTVVEDLQAARITPPSQISSFSGIPSPHNPPTIVDSGLDHDFSHPYCATPPGVSSNRLIATLFYKANNGHRGSHHSELSPRRLPSPKPGAAAADAADSSEIEIPANLAPTTDLSSFPLEPPTAADTEQLDHLYGSYISPLCITSFLYLMSTFPPPPGSVDLTSSHRCLDNAAHPRVVEVCLDPAPAPTYLSLDDLRKHELIYRFEREWNVDVALQADTLWRRYPRLVVFDMDSTLITQEVIDLLAAALQDRDNRSAAGEGGGGGGNGIAARVADITHRAMLGELEFEAAFRERVALLKGLPASVFDDLRGVLNVTEGVRPLLRALRRLGVKTAVLSGGFLPLTRWLAAELGINHAHANEVVVDGAGRLTGEVKGAIVGRERKRDLLLEIAAAEGVALDQVIAVGDGANDLLMMEAAGLGVAWNAKPRVQMEAGARLNSDSMLDLLYLFGLKNGEIQELIA